MKTFQVTNQGNIPCNGQKPCSPDGKWKAAIGSESLDSGEGNLFQNARVSCIAGPCPFTRIDSDGFSKPARTISVTVRDWSDTTTFLLQAEVYLSVVNNLTRLSYPVIFGRSMNSRCRRMPRAQASRPKWTERKLFPISPDPVLSWADCSVRVKRNKRKTIDVNSSRDIASNDLRRACAPGAGYASIKKNGSGDVPTSGFGSLDDHSFRRCVGCRTSSS